MVILVVVVGVEYSLRNCQVVPMGKNAGVNQLKSLKTLGQTLGLDTWGYVYRVTELGFPKLNLKGEFSSGVTKRRLNGV